MTRSLMFSRHVKSFVAAAGLFVAPSVTLQADGEETPPPATGWLAEQVESVNSSHVLVAFQTLSGRDPVTQADLWCTQDRGATWRKALAMKQPESPFDYTVPADGLYGFYLVLHNAKAASPAPLPGTAAHTWVRVDRTPPLAQILALTPDTRFDLNREILIRWSAHDDNCGDRPVALHYRCEQTKRYEPITRDVAATGAYRWTVPEDVSGRLDIKVTATDRAGNGGVYVADWLEIADDQVRSARSGDQKDAVEAEPPPDHMSPGATELTPTAEMPSTIHSEPDAGEKTLRRDAAKAAKKQYDLGTWHRLRGDYAVAIERYRDALRYFPGYAAARNDLAGLLALRGAVKEAQSEYRRLLKTNPRHRPALKGLALVQAKQRDYRSAFETLQKVLLLEPDNAETWLNFGDVCMFMGDRPAAREAWTKANDLTDAPKAVKTRALRRLDIYQPGGLATGSNKMP